VLVRGMVSDLASAAALGNARVIALDPSKAPNSTLAVTASNGTYEIDLDRAPRDANGKPVQSFITLRSDRAGYATFPGGTRVALPIDVSSAVQDGDRWVVSGTLTNLKLLALVGAGAASLHGNVGGANALVVAEPASGAVGVVGTGYPDANGDYVIENLTPGIVYVVQAYTKGANYTPVTTAALAAGDNAAGQLALASGAGASFTGNLIFNNGANTAIQVTLVVQSTFNVNLDRGESPPGLTVDGGSGGYTFDGVPDGHYVVLAPFGLTGDVRDISGGGNTAAPQITITAGAIVGSPPGFKIIPAVDLLTIGGVTVSGTPATVTTATPDFTWMTTNVDSSSATYRVLVFDAFGTQIWQHDQAATASSNSITYASTTALVVGMTYQLRILAIKETNPTTSFTQDSQTEDVKGVFIYQP
jgi:hypothetical protein